MSTVRAGYVAGDWVAISAPGCWLLVDLPPNDETVQRCWAAVSAGREIEDVLDILVAGGVRSTPSFALVRAADGAGRAVVRGSATVRVLTGGRLDELSAAERTVWTDEPVAAEAEEIILLGGKPGLSEVELPMASGVTLAATVHVYTAEFAAPTLAVTPDTVSEPDTAAEPDAAAEARPAPPAEQTVTPTEPDVRAATSAELEGTPEPEEPPAPGGSYDHLFGATQRPLPPDSVPTATVPVPPPATDDPGYTATWNTMVSPVEGSEPAQAAPTSPSVATETPGLIDSVPGWGASVAAESMPGPVGDGPDPQVVDEPPDEVMRTTNRAAILAAVAQEAAAQPPIVGPTVLAGRCPAGHLTPPHSAHCRVCGAPVAEQQGFEIPRPSLGVLRLSNGDSVALDRGVLIGRAPSLPESGTERPHLVRVNSPENDVSRNHAEVVLEGWHVFVRDLGSTNGTTVELPGQPPVRLRDGDLQLLENGAVITLADEIRCVFEVTA